MNQYIKLSELGRNSRFRRERDSYVNDVSIRQLFKYRIEIEWKYWDITSVMMMIIISLEKRLSESEIRKRIETTQTTTLLDRPGY